MSVRIAPSILSADFARLADAVATVEAAGADQIHVDVMDGHFVPNITIGPPVVAALSRVTRLPLDVHLMITDPDRYLEAFASAGASIITVHTEAVTHLHRTLSRIRQLGARAGVAINPATPLDHVQEVAGDFDVLLIMSVNPGFGGQKFITSSLRKTASARAMIDKSGSRALLEVDGGVKIDNAAQVLAAGADVLVAGSAIFSSRDYAVTIAAIRAAGQPSSTTRPRVSAHR